MRIRPAWLRGLFDRRATRQKNVTTLRPSYRVYQMDEKRQTIYRLRRERIVQEDQLIHVRMTWMLGTQAILFALWGGLRTSLDGKQFIVFWREVYIVYIIKGMLCIISLAGMAAAWGSGRSIKAARDEIDFQKEAYRQLYPELDLLLPDIRAAHQFHESGHIVTKYGPWFFFGLWFVIFWYSFLLFWVKEIDELLL